MEWEFDFKEAKARLASWCNTPPGCYIITISFILVVGTAIGYFCS